ncbi:MAG: glycosyltransferase family 2 protein [Terracidiphilus sp.]|nr:glycosyltransferase family 2 protein [Terracidiphilus sp.]
MQETANYPVLLSPTLLKNSEQTVTIVICTRNRPASLMNCLNGIARLERAPDEIVVVDNTYGDTETEAVARAFSAVYKVEPIAGLSRARNRGLASSTSDIVAFMDDDATPDAHWLEFILLPFEDPQVTTVTGRIVTPQSFIRPNSMQSARSLSNRDPEWFEIATFGGLGLGSNMAFRRDSCGDQGIFNERLGRGAPLNMGEEHYAFACLLSRGHTAVYMPDAIIFHPSAKRNEITTEARNSIAYWMLLFAEFPQHRIDLLKFLVRRLRRKPLTWPRDSPEPGEVITSGCLVLVKASLAAILLYFRSRKPQNR